MFGINDNDGQTDQAQPVADNQGGGAPAIMDNPFTAPDSPSPSAPPAPPVAIPDVPVALPANDSPVADGATKDNLLGLKQQALQSLAPILGQLDQTPEEKFKTTMMLIQASDNADLVKEAYEAANQIQDEKARAQALLDVVNEINYFSQQKAS